MSFDSTTKPQTFSLTRKQRAYLEAGEQLELERLDARFTAASIASVIKIASEMFGDLTALDHDDRPHHVTVNNVDAMLQVAYAAARHLETCVERPFLRLDDAEAEARADGEWDNEEDQVAADRASLVIQLDAGDDETLAMAAAGARTTPEDLAAELLGDQLRCAAAAVAEKEGNR